jgi:hypothetical protein
MPDKNGCIGRWKVAAASARGISHVREDVPCQDSVYYKVEDDWLCAVVSDGAGSAKHSDMGSQVAAYTVVETLYENFQANPESQNRQEAIQQQVRDAVITARAKLQEHSESKDLQSFHATLVGVIITPGTRLFFHIGDGCAVAISDKHWEQGVVSEPHNGEYANETFFYTLDDWQDYLRFQEVPQQADLILLMSDGAMGFVMARGQQQVDPGFIEPVDKFLASVDEKKGSNALAATLDDPKTHSITNDDKTLLWARAVEK